MFSKLPSAISHIISESDVKSGSTPLTAVIKVIPKADKIITGELGISFLEAMHYIIIDAEGDTLATKHAEMIYGKDCRKLITAHQAARIIDDWLDENSLFINENSYSLLIENRRNPFSPSAIKSGFVRGNRHKYGYLPFLRGKKAMYFESVVRRWLEENVKPVAEPDTKATS